jgi:steroid delta-isomerase-like uncharacterized protein
MKKTLKITAGILISSLFISYPCFAYEKEMSAMPDTSAEIKDSKVEAENKAILLNFYEEIFHKAKIDDIGKFISTDAIDHDMPAGIPQTLENMKEGFKMYLTAFPDMKMHVEDIIAKGDKVVARLSYSGTHKGNFMGIPATGKKVKGTAVDIVRFKDGKMVEHWSEQNMLPFMEQLGMSLMPGQHEH